MTVQLLDQAEQDLAAACRFYEARSAGLGRRFLDSIAADIDALEFRGGIHEMIFGFHRVLAHRYPFAVFYRLEGDLVRVYAVVDCRRDPAWIREHLQR